MPSYVRAGIRKCARIRALSMNLPLYALWCLADVAGLVAEDDEPDRPFTMQTQVV